MLQFKLAAARGLHRRTVCSACIAHPQSRLQSWRPLPVARAWTPVHAFATSTDSAESTTTKPAKNTQGGNKRAEKTKEVPGPTKKSKSTDSPSKKHNAQQPDGSTTDSKANSKADSTAKTVRKNKMHRQSRSGPPGRVTGIGMRLARKADATVAVDDKMLSQVLGTLRQLEKNYASLNDGVQKLNSKQKASGQPKPSTQAGVPDATDTTPGSKSETKKQLESRMKTISATLNVLKNVLNTQNIPIDKLGKKAAAKKSDSKDNLGSKAPAKKASASTPSKSKPSVRQAAQTAATAAVTSLAARLAKGSGQPQKAPPVAPKSAPAPADEPQAQPPRLGRKKGTPVTIDTLRADAEQLTPVEQLNMPPVAKLAYGLDRVLFNPGVYQLQDPHTKVYNFDPYLSKIMPLTEFDFSALQRYVTSSKDSTMYQLAAKLGKKYTGSTSSMTAILSHFHFLLSSWRPISAKHLSRSFPLEYDTFATISRAPAAAFLHVRDGIYAIDADKEHDTANILSMLGKSMEKLLTLSKDDFERYRHANSAQITEKERNAAEAYHFSTLGDFLMRSQLDANDARLPGTGMFDLKTRAVISIRMDAAGFQKGLGYEIRDRFGEWESFEREYFDMIRSAFLKYSLQVRMGRMDGIYVAYHNTERIFGFQYVSLKEMDRAIHGSNDVHLGDEEFKLSLQLLNKVLDRATERFPNRPIRLHVETRPGNPPFMYIFAKPVTPAEIDKVQSANRAAVAQFESKFLGLQASDGEVQPQSPESDVESQQQPLDDDVASSDANEASRQSPLEYWQEMREKVEEAVEDDARGVSHVREAIQEALEQSGLLKAKSPVEARNYVSGLLDALVRTDAVDEQDAFDANSEQFNDVADEADQGDRPLDIPSSSSRPDVVESVEEAGEQTSTDQLPSAASPVTPALQTSMESTRTSDRSLKDLIVKAAERLDERSEEAGARTLDDDSSDKYQLREFERILSELVARKSTEQVAADEEAEEPMSIEFDKPHPTENPMAPRPSESEAIEDEDGDLGGETDVTLSVSGDDILGMHLVIRNKVDRNYVERPGRDHSPKNKWTVEYSLEEIPTQSAKSIYRAIQARRKKAFEFGDQESRDQNWRTMFSGKLEQLSRGGRKYRAAEDEKARNGPIYTVESEEPLNAEAAFAEHRQWKGIDMTKK